MIIITGDSWSQHEYNDDGSFTGVGFGIYLSMNNYVINVGHGGNSNEQSIQSLEHLLMRFTKDTDCDTFYWVVTDPVRSIGDNDPTRKVLEDALDNSFRLANDLAKQYNITINLIGGQCDLPESLNYSNLNVIVPSWGKLLEKMYPTGLCFDMPIMENRQYVASEELIEYFDEISRKYEFTKQSDLFKAGHPTTKGHLKLAFYLDPNFKKYYLTHWEE
jgi:hypothetical protein